MFPFRPMQRAIAQTFAVLLMCGAAGADDDHRDAGKREYHRQDQLREAVEHGDVKPLSEVLRLVKPKLPGDIVGVEVERKGGTWIYEFRVLDTTGRVLDVYVDAATAEITETKEK